MGRHSIITRDEVLRAVMILRYVTRFNLILFFAGGKRRIKFVEKMLPALEREGLLIVEWHEGEKVYSVARENKGKPVSLAHEIACALVLVLFWRCRMAEGEIVPERKFRGFGIVPEAGIRYSKERGTMLIFEHCTEKNFRHGGVMKSKITRYIKYLPLMEKKFGRKINVVFILDIERSEVKAFVKRLDKLIGFNGTEERDDGSVADGDTSALYEGDRFPLDPFFFTDFETLKSVPVGKALTATVYFWHDGSEWSLSDND